MITDTNLLPRLLTLQKTIFSSLRLRDVLDAALLQFSELTGGGKVAIFLSDNDSVSLKLVSIRGYQEATAAQIRILSFTAESLLKPVVQRRQPAVARNLQEAPDIGAAIMQREGSKAEIALPLIASNLLVGAVLIDVPDDAALCMVEILKDVADLVALAVANAILFGRSEYERDRLSTLYKTAVALSGSSLEISQVLQIAADTALILSGTPSCAILIYDQQRQGFHLGAFKGLDGDSFNSFNLSIEDTIAGRALVSGKSEYVQDALRYQYDLPRSTSGDQFGSVVAVPMIHNNEPIGVMMVFATEMRAYHREQVDLLDSLAVQVGNALYVGMAHESATSQSIQDAHTGLFNRWHFEDLLDKEIERSSRHKREMALLVIDIDHLSRVNDLLGPEKGDAAIRHVAKMIKDALRDIDIPCRFGSEEFAVLLPETPRQNALDVAERLRQQIRSNAAPSIGILTVSIGLSTFPGNGEHAPSLIKAAEQALDVAKFEGRDRVKMADLPNQTGQIAWDELARQAKLANLSDRQSRLQKSLAVEPEYAPWMRATPGWSPRKKQD